MPTQDTAPVPGVFPADDGLTSPGDWDSGNPAFAISRGSPSASPHTPGHDRWFPGMLFSLCAFRLQVSHQIQRYTSNLSSLREGYKPAPRGAVVALSSPNVVSDAVHLAG